MDKFSLLQEREASVWKRRAENSSEETKVGRKSFMPEKIGLRRTLSESGIKEEYR